MKVSGGAAVAKAALSKAVEAAVAFCLDIAEAGRPEIGGAAATDPSNGVANTGGDSIPPGAPGKGTTQRRGKVHVAKGQGPSEGIEGGARSGGGTGGETPVPGNRKRKASSQIDGPHEADKHDAKGAVADSGINVRKRDVRVKDSKEKRVSSKEPKVERKKRGQK